MQLLIISIIMHRAAQSGYAAVPDIEEDREERLREMVKTDNTAREQYHQYYDLLEVGICMVLADGTERIAFASRQTALLYECGSEEEVLDFCSSSYRNMVDEEDYKPIAEIAGAHGDHFYLTFHYRTKNAHYRKAEGIGWLKKTDFGPAYILQLFSAEQIAEDRKSDDMTGLLGRHDFFNEALRRAQKQKANHTLRAFCPVTFDVTRFKEYNRLHGTHRGDQCLKKIGDTITGYFPGALVGHLAADQFAALLSDENLEARLEYICNEVNRYINDAGIQLKAGVYRPSEEDTLDDLRHSFDSAKIACDSIKQDGNRTVAIYRRSMGESISNKIYVLRHFSEALEKHYIKVYFQPVIRTMTGDLCGFEALSRWEDPVRGMISPAIFIPVLEEAQLIHRLDRFILERVLGLFQDRMENSLPLIPVSINLSAYDFEAADPIDTIEKMVSRYRVPRSVLCFEITERVMIRNRRSMVSIIRQFQKAGYQVWMDDFGSEYSSLNSLHNYHFDVIKIDMGFFSHFDDRSRQIITSVVSMAKMLGVQTLAEGVETKEQVSFLRKIGCGRIQGFYYGRPMLYEDTLDFTRAKSLRLESPEESQLLDAAENVNVISDLPTALFSFDGEIITLLIENDAYRRELRSTGTQGMQEANANLANEDYPFRGRFIHLLNSALRSKKEETLIYVDNGQYMRVSVRWIAGGEKLWVGAAHIYNISTKSEMQDAKKMDTTLRNIFHFYEGCYFLDRGKNEVRVLRSEHPGIPSGEAAGSISSFFEAFAEKFVYPDDRERFLAFIRHEQAGAEERRGDGVHWSELARIRREDGTYLWKVFEALAIYKSRTKNVLLCEREDIWERKPDRDQLLPVFCRSLGVSACGSPVPEGEEESGLFRALRASSPYPFFWKNRDGRILGASSAFLRRGGFRDETAFLGKTEAEAGWYINPSASRQAEEKVLHEGENRTETEEQVLTGGKLRDIRVAWVPWYQEKEIAGTLGMVSSPDASDEADSRLGLNDPETGLLSFRGAIEAGLAYADQYRLHKVDYIGFLIDISAYTEVQRKDAGKAEILLREITRMLQETFVSGWAVARIGLCCFLCFCRRENAADIEEKIETVSAALPALWKQQGIPANPVLLDAVVYGSEVKSLDELLQLLIRRLSSVEKHVYGESLYTGDRIVILREALDNLPESVVISDPKTYELIYMNQTARRDVGIGADDPLEGKFCYEVLEGISQPCRDCPNLMLRKDRAYAASHLSHKTGENFLVRSLLIPWEERTLRITLSLNMSRYTNTMAKDHELIYQELRANEAISLGMAEEDPNRGIEKIIECISKNLKPERFLIFEERDDNTVSATYEWTAPGVLPLKEELQSLPRTELRALYADFFSHHVVLVSDMAAFQAEHPDFSLRLHGVRSFVSGQLTLPDRTEGFTMVINPSQDTFRVASLLLSTLTDFIAIMIRNRNSIHQLEEQSMKDQLTGAGNRRGLERRVREWDGGGVLGVISVDLNGLKNINDTEGHHAGDMLIRETARILRECAGADSVFRTGGDEFVVVTENMEERDILLLIQHMRESADNNGISMAVGFAFSQGKVSDFDALLTMADLNMYKDKGHSYRRRREDRMQET